MPTDYTVVLFSRQHFGDKPGAFDALEPTVPFVGLSKDFSFNCPGVNPSETAFLMFQSAGVETRTNIFQINGVDVFGGIPVGPGWNGNILLVERHHQLKAAGNVLHVEARNVQPGKVDNFIIDNVVIVYKTRSGPLAGAGTLSPK